jgi:hypothetical protein
MRRQDTIFHTSSPSSNCILSALEIYNEEVRLSTRKTTKSCRFEKIRAGESLQSEEEIVTDYGVFLSVLIE